MKYFKAVDDNLMSLGLKRVTPIKYKINKWVYPREKPQKGEFTPGGLWVGKHSSFISWLRRYMRLKYQKEIRIFSCEIGEILFETVNRIKTTKVKLIEEV